MVLHSEPHWPSESCSTSCKWNKLESKIWESNSMGFRMECWNPTTGLEWNWILIPDIQSHVPCTNGQIEKVEYLSQVSNDTNEMDLYLFISCWVLSFISWKLLFLLTSLFYLHHSSYVWTTEPNYWMTSTSKTYQILVVKLDVPYLTSDKYYKHQMVSCKP